MARVIHVAALTGDSICRAGIIHLVAALCSPVWQNRKRTSFRPLLKANLPDMFAIRQGRIEEAQEIGRWGYRLSGRRCPTGPYATTSRQAGEVDQRAPPGI